VLYENAKPSKATLVIMGGNAKHELAGRKWRLFSLFKHQKNNSETST